MPYFAIEFKHIHPPKAPCAILSVNLHPTPLLMLKGPNKGYGSLFLIPIHFEWPIEDGMLGCV